MILLIYICNKFIHFLNNNVKGEIFNVVMKERHFEVGDLIQSQRLLDYKVLEITKQRFGYDYKVVSRKYKILDMDNNKDRRMAVLVFGLLVIIFGMIGFGIYKLFKLNIL